MNTTELTYAFLQINAILQPKIIGSGKNKKTVITDSNLELLKSFDFNSQLKEIRVFVGQEKKTYIRKEPRMYGTGFNEIEVPKDCVKIGIKGPDFHYTFDAEKSMDVWNKLRTMLPKAKDEILISDPAKDNFNQLTYFTGQDLKNIKQAGKFTGIDQFRPVFSNVLIQDKKIVASDACRLFHKDIEYPGHIMLTPEMLKFIRSTKNELFVFENETQLKLQNEKNYQIFEKYDYGLGQFPAWQMIIPNNLQYFITVERKKLIETVNQVAPYCSKASNCIQLTVKNNRLTVSGQDIDFDTFCVKELHCVSDYDGYIAFNGNFLLDCLKANDNSLVKIELNDSTRPGLIDSNCLLMHMQQYNVYNPDEVKKPEIKENYSIAFHHSYSIAGYDKSAIMKNAWLQWRSKNNTYSWSECMKFAWMLAIDQANEFKINWVNRYNKAA